MKRYEQVMKELHHKKILLQQAVVRELLLDPSYIADIHPDDVHAFDDSHKKYIQAALYLQDQFSIISLRSYLLSQGTWTQNDENYLARILSSTSNIPISYALPELRRISASISVYSEIYQKLIHAMISGETPATHLNVLPVPTNTEPPEREWLIPYLMPKDELTILAGIGSIGKTTLALQMAISLLSRKNFHPDLPCQSISRVMVLTAEDDYNEVCRKAHRITQAVGVSSSDGLLFYSPAELTSLSYGTIQKTPEYDQLVRYIRDMHIDLVIVDSLTSVFCINLVDPAHIRYVIRLLRALPCTVLTLHHMNKSIFKLDDPEKLLNSIFGSVAVVNLTRHVLCLHDHFLFVIKSNIGPKAGLYSFLRYHGAYEVGHHIFIGDEVDRELHNIIEDQKNGNGKNGHNGKIKKQEVSYEPF